MNSENMKVLTNIIGAVESGSQIYGQRNYAAYADPYTSTPNEHTITVGWAQNYGDEARRLMQMIYDASPAAWNRMDPDGIVKKMLPEDWVAIRWKPSAKQKEIIIKLIDSETGHKCQDELFSELMDKYIADCGKDYPAADIPAQMMYCEIRHLGGKGPVDRIFKRCSGNFSLDNIMAALDKDDPGSNQVGSKKFRSRHLKCIEFIRKYAKDEKTVGTTIVKEFEKYIGTVEYNGIIADIQIWYYGSLVKDAWCATSTSYFANKAGILDQLGGKNEGVYEMMNACRALHKTDGRFWDYPNIPRDLKKDDIIFFKRSGMSHVAHLWCDQTYTGTGMINVIGGNQSDMICKKDYKQIGIQAVYRPKYAADPPKKPWLSAEIQTISKGDKGSSVRILQEIFRAREYKDQYGFVLKVDGDFQDKTDWVLRWYQNARKKAGADINVDGICGQKTWHDLLAVTVKTI